MLFVVAQVYQLLKQCLELLSLLFCLVTRLFEFLFDLWGLLVITGAHDAYVLDKQKHGADCFILENFY